MIVYMIDPIDFWVGWMTENEFKANIDLRYWGPNERKHAWNEYLTLKWKALGAARNVGWEGDIREGPLISAIPSADGDVRYIIAWKQDNNGTTFVATPYPLPWLVDDFAYNVPNYVGVK